MGCIDFGSKIVDIGKSHARTQRLTDLIHNATHGAMERAQIIGNDTGVAQTPIIGRVSIDNSTQVERDQLPGLQDLIKCDLWIGGPKSNGGMPDSTGAMF